MLKCIYETRHQGIDDKALKRALRFIDYRPRSGGETRDRLRRWGYSVAVIDEVIDYLQSKGFIDDPLFIRLFMEEMLRKGFGCRRVRNELRKKKLESDLIGDAMSEYPFQQETERARGVASLRVSRMVDDEPVARRKRIKSYLIRQGYSPEVAEEVCRLDIIDSQTGREYN